MKAAPSTSILSTTSTYPEIPTAQIYKLNGKRLKRGDLSKMNMQKLFAILEELEARSEVANSDLVALLLKRDQLHLENDSLRMEVEDVLNFNNTKKLDVSPSLVYEPTKVKQRCK